MINLEVLEDYNRLMKDYNSIQKRIEDKEKEFREENKLLFDTLLRLSESINQVKDNLKVQGLEEFRETGVKKLTGGLSIREKYDVQYNEEEAFKWALEHKMALKLDTTKFKQLAKVQELGFVKISTNPMVCFPSKIEE